MERARIFFAPSSVRTIFINHISPGFTYGVMLSKSEAVKLAVGDTQIVWLSSVGISCQPVTASSDAARTENCACACSATPKINTNKHTVRFMSAIIHQLAIAEK